MEVKNENQVEEEKVCGCKTEGVCNCNSESSCVGIECGDEANMPKLMGIDYAKPIAEGDITGLPKVPLTEEEIEKQRIKDLEDMRKELRQNFEDRIYPQLRRVGVAEDRLILFADIIDIFGTQGHSGTTAAYVHNFIALGVNDGWDELDVVINKSLEQEAADPEQDGMQTLITSQIREIKDMIINANLSKDECQYILRLMSSRPLVPVEGLDDEWMSLEKYGDMETEQNKICTSVFRKKGDNSTAYYLYANSYSSDGGIAWFNGNTRGIIKSAQPITFPFEVPESSNHIYVEEIADGEYIDITGNEERIAFLKDYFKRAYSYNVRLLSFAEAVAKVTPNKQFRSILTDQKIVICYTDKGIEIQSNVEGYSIEIDRFTKFIEEDCSLPDCKDEAGTDEIITCCTKDYKTCEECPDMPRCHVPKNPA